MPGPGLTYGKNRKNFNVYGAGEFIAAITQHIPEKNYQLVRYYGWYSNRSRGARLKAERPDAGDMPSAGADVIAIADYEPRRMPPPKWRECIKKVWEVDPLRCPRCQGEMKIVGFITDYPVIRKILKHLDLWERPPPVAPVLPDASLASPSARACTGEGLVYEPLDDGWPGYEEPVCAV
ncbi:MAG: transposase [Deltaproteobacteria bacterium]|nr:transposase [Candidatus Anaeroferrophillacea bacterium]